jgi:hypothetical protein
MPFIIFKLLFAALALGLLVVVAMTVREIWRKRLARTLASPRKAATASAGDKPAKLGLQSWSSAEPEPELGSRLPPKRQVVDQALEPPAAEPPVGKVDGDFHQVMLGRLEVAFDRLEAGEITLDAYGALLLTEQAAADRRIVAARSGGAAAALEHAMAARDAVLWCRDWAKDQGDSGD